MGGLDEAIKKRLKFAMGVSFEQAVEVLELVLPTLEAGIEGDAYGIHLAATAERLSAELKVYMEARRSQDETMVGKLREVVPILRDAKYELAHIMTLEGAREYFMKADLNTVLAIMKAFDRGVRIDALVLMSLPEYEAWVQDIEAAGEEREALD